ncbi:hypothetical protein GCM10010520_46910 [Rhizobium viscosum]
MAIEASARKANDIFAGNRHLIPDWANPIVMCSLPITNEDPAAHFRPHVLVESATAGAWRITAPLEGKIETHGVCLRKYVTVNGEVNAAADEHVIGFARRFTASLR